MSFLTDADGRYLPSFCVSFAFNCEVFPASRIAATSRGRRNIRLSQPLFAANAANAANACSPTQLTSNYVVVQ